MIAIELPIPFVLGRMAYVNKYLLDDNPFELSEDDGKSILEVVDRLAKEPLTLDKVDKIFQYVKSQPKYYQWIMGYRFERLRLQIARKYDDKINEKFYNSQTKVERRRNG